MDGVGHLAGLEEANAALDAMIAAEAGTATTTPDSATPEQRAAQPEASAVQAQPDTITDTPAAAEPQATAPEETEATLEADARGADQPVKPAPVKPAEDKTSKFAKDAARRDTSWKALNAEKEAHAREVAQLKADRDAWQQERAEQEASNQVTPEKYRNYATQMRAKADHLKAEAKRLEEAGKYDEAEKHAKAAQRAELKVEEALEAAEEHAKNPPPTQTQLQQQQQAAEREWTLKAATDFPEFAKTGSALQQQVAANLVEMKQAAPRMLRDPKAIYFVTKLTAAEATAARVPAMEKELGQMKARVKELEALTSPGDAGQPARLPGQIPFDQRSREEQFAELEQMAQGLSLR